MYNHNELALPYADMDAYIHATHVGQAMAAAAAPGTAPPSMRVPYPVSNRLGQRHESPYFIAPHVYDELYGTDPTNPLPSPFAEQNDFGDIESDESGETVSQDYLNHMEASSIGSASPEFYFITGRC